MVIATSLIGRIYLSLGGLIHLDSGYWDCYFAFFIDLMIVLFERRAVQHLRPRTDIFLFPAFKHICFSVNVSLLLKLSLMAMSSLPSSSFLTLIVFLFLPNCFKFKMDALFN